MKYVTTRPYGNHTPHLWNCIGKTFSYVLKLKNPKLTKRPIRDLRFEIKVTNKHEKKRIFTNCTALKWGNKPKKSCFKMNKELRVTPSRHDYSFFDDNWERDLM
jgi:hypothetical protein